MQILQRFRNTMLFHETFKEIFNLVFLFSSFITQKESKGYKKREEMTNFFIPPTLISTSNLLKSEDLKC